MTASRPTALRSLALVLAGAALGALAFLAALRTGLLDGGATAPAAEAEGQVWFCPMHPDYRSDEPGDCPICSMRLVPMPTGDEAAAGPAATDHAAAHVTIDPRRQQLVGVKLAAVARVPASVTVEASGTVQPDETRIAHVHVKVMGFIEDVLVDYVGAPVRRGQALFTMYSPELVATQAEYLSARRHRDRMASSPLPWAREAADALVAAARDRLLRWDVSDAEIRELERRGAPLRELTLHSPVDGVVVERMAYHHGRTVSPDMDVYAIVDLSRVWVQAEVFESEVSHVHPGQAAEVRLPYEPGLAPVHGTVAFVQPTVSPVTRTVRVRIEVPNPDLALRPDQFVEVTLRKNLGEQLVVPEDAVVDSGRAQVAFVARGEGAFEPRTIVAGPLVEGGRVVLSGLEAGEQVAASANFLVDSESRLRGALEAFGDEGSGLVELGSGPHAAHGAPAGEHPHGGHRP
jgi:Cu(I)/Ag(I) efflux system membrane fusion protein